MTIRLNKLLSSRGIGARRKCDAIVAEGRVRVNGRVVLAPGTMIDERRDRVEVDGRPLPKSQKHSYFVINKPVGVITTLDDPQGRRTIAEFLPRGRRLFPVGRLDADTSGLLLLTNDGDLAHRLMHPRYGVVKVYRVRLDREPGPRQLERLARGVEFERGVTSAPARVRRIDPGFDAIMIEIAIHEGRFRQVRRMCEAVGLNVTGLHRVGYGPVRLGPLARGMWRELADSEVERLRAASSEPRRRGAPASAPERPARVARRTPPAAGRAARGARRDEAAEVEDRWIPGGGFAPEAGDAGGAEEWPARASRDRGDEAFRSRRPNVAGRGESPPWHAPGFRRGPAKAGFRESNGPRSGAGPGRRRREDGKPRRGEARGGDARASRADRGTGQGRGPARAISPRSERRSGPERARPRREAPPRKSDGRRSRPEDRTRRPRNR